MAASKPIFLSTYIKTLLISLNNNFGTLTTLFWAVSLLTYNLIVKCLIVQHSSLPFREQILANRVFTTPPYAQGIITLEGYNSKRVITILKDLMHNCPRSQFCTCYDVIEPHTYICFAENQLQQSGLSFTNLPQFFGYLYNDNPFGLL